MIPIWPPTKIFRPSYAVFLTGGGGPMNDYIFNSERSCVTPTFVDFFPQNKCFVIVLGYFELNEPKKINFHFFFTDRALYF